MLLKVEQMVAAEWARLGRHLGLEDYILDEIDANCKHVADKCSSVLRKWLKSSGCNMEELRKALLDIGRRDVVNTIDQLEGYVSFVDKHLFFVIILYFCFKLKDERAKVLKL